jgi:4-amino-4-deoxy-L-arabinose transferase-like glycosyltransferase
MMRKPRPSARAAERSVSHSASIPRDEAAGVAGAPARISFWLVLHVLVWTLYATVSSGPADIHHDMAEAYSWGREFQLGYYKHPPFWAWVAGLWFTFMPRADWAYYLLSMVNAVLGLWAAWLIAGRFIEDRAARLTAVLLLELLPFYHFLAFKFNANTIMLSLWAWAIYFFLRVVEERSVRAAVGLGVVAGLGLLSKYYFAVLLVAFGAATLLDARRWEILRSPAPWIAIAVATVLFAPHVWWLTQNDFAPFKYVSDSAQSSRAYIAWKALQFGAGCVLLHAVLIIFLTVFADGPRSALLRTFDWRASTPARRRLIVIVFAPVLLTMLIALATNVKVDTNFAIGVFPVTPLLLMTTPGYRLDPRARNGLPRGVMAFMAAMLAAAPVLAYVRFAAGIDRADEPRKEAALAMQTIWEKEFGKPLRLVAGGWPYGEEAPFYAAGDVSHYTYLTRAFAPWVTDARLARDGVAVICVAADADCVTLARTRLPGPMRQAAFTAGKRFLGREGRKVDFLVLMQPPAASP